MTDQDHTTNAPADSDVEGQRIRWTAVDEGAQAPTPELDDPQAREGMKVKYSP